MEAAPHPWPALGALLLRDGALTVEKLEEALREKQTSSKRLGEMDGIRVVLEGKTSLAEVRRVTGDRTI